MPIPLILWGIGAAAAAFFATDCSGKKEEDGKAREVDGKADAGQPDRAELIQQAQVALANAPTNACHDEFVYIPAGSFMMGSETLGHPDESPVHAIYTDAYCMAKFETTFAQYYKVILKTPMEGAQSKRPWANVSWKDSDAYCKAIGGRLPTESEWEKAARGPRGLEYGTKSGALSREEANYNILTGKEANYDELKYNIGNEDVCSYPANDYGLCDMTGNVWEWVNDWYHDRAYELWMTPQNPQGPDYGIAKVDRGGGSHTIDVGDLRAARRHFGHPDHTHGELGFRCVVLPKDPKK